MRITVLYFAQLKDHRGRSTESIQTDCLTVGALYSSLGLDNEFHLPRGHVRPAVNEVFCDYDAVLNEGDVVAFMPPMCGG
ncbi:MAG: MoaD/ThiS family protein [Limisphaerales bacterium]|jgi:molybdopterin synthase sulfur carrier subunit